MPRAQFVVTELICGNLMSAGTKLVGAPATSHARAASKSSNTIDTAWTRPA